MQNKGWHRHSRRSKLPVGATLSAGEPLLNGPDPADGAEVKGQMRDQDKGVSIEWSIEDVEQPSVASRSAPAVEESVETERVRQGAKRIEMQVAALGIVLFVLLLGGWFWQKQQLASQTTSELQAAVIQEFRAQPGITHPQADQVAQSSKTPPSGTAVRASDPAVDVGEYRRLNNRIMAHMTVYYMEDGNPTPYRETHFFQKTTDGWQRIEPDPNLLGPLQKFNSGRFSFHYRAVDTALIYQTAPKIEQLYNKLGRDFGLPVAGAMPVADATSVYTIEVALNGMSDWYTLSVDKRTLTIPSPTALSVPVAVSAESVLYYAAVYPLARLVVHEYIEQHEQEWQINFRRWPSVPLALRLWLLWEEGGPLGAGREEAVRWLSEGYATDGATDGATERHSSDEEYALLCRTRRIWQTTPQDFFLFLPCHGKMQELLIQDQDYRQVWQQKYFANELYTLNAAFGIVQNGGTIFSMATLLDYIVATYGREQLLVMLEALGQHHSIESLIPAVFAPSADEFEAGWQAYLAEHYGLK